MTITVLGSGTSHGIPVIKCRCKVCASKDKRDIRRRASILVEETRGAAKTDVITTVADGITVKRGETGGRGGACILVDTGCDFRAQMLQARVRRLDAVFLTHSHADHLHGLDDIRPLTWDAAVPVYGSALTIHELRGRFDYIFKETQRGGGKPKITTEALEGAVQVGGIVVQPVPVKHGELEIFAYTFTQGNAACAYVTDCSGLPANAENSVKALACCQTLILGALRKKEHPTHFSFEEAFDFARGLYRAGGRLRRVYLTHISHETSHRQIAALCGQFLKTAGLPGLSIAPARDMLSIETA